MTCPSPRSPAFVFDRRTMHSFQAASLNASRRIRCGRRYSGPSIAGGGRNHPSTDSVGGVGPGSGQSPLKDARSGANAESVCSQSNLVVVEEQHRKVTP
jgi:hypothetical protein